LLHATFSARPPHAAASCAAQPIRDQTEGRNVTVNRTNVRENRESHRNEGRTESTENGLECRGVKENTAQPSQSREPKEVQERQEYSRHTIRNTFSQAEAFDIS
jgi:hypothetical protein